MSRTEAPLPAMVDALPDVPAELETKWALVEQKVQSDRLKRALRRVVAGESYREAAFGRTTSDVPGS